jgi:uncharacterized membrane protein
MADATEKTDRGVKRTKTAGMISCVLWILGFALSFVIPGKSAYSWVPDTLLLVGFFPVMFVHPAGWTWLVFGILNVAIGFILEIGYQLPDDVFPVEVNILRKGLQATHPTLVWILLGAICTVYGVFRIIKTVVRFIRHRASKSA